MLSSFSVSPCSSRPTGMPVQLDTTSAMSDAPTSSETIGFVCQLGLVGAGQLLLQLRDLVRTGSRLALCSSPSRCSRSASVRSSSIFALRSPTWFRPCFSASQRASSPRSSSSASASSLSSRCNRSLLPTSVSFSSAKRCIFIRSTLRRSLSISSGEESISIRSRDAASSTRSIALSGSCRDVM